MRRTGRQDIELLLLRCAIKLSARAEPGGSSISTLICGTCGAPLSSQKARPLAPGKGARLPGAEAPKVAVANPMGKKPKSTKPMKPAYKKSKGKKPKKRKGLLQKFLSEAVDIVEDIFD